MKLKRCNEGSGNGFVSDIILQIHPLDAPWLEFRATFAMT
jgi:hypothetical protein